MQPRAVLACVLAAALLSTACTPDAPSTLVATVAVTGPTSIQPGTSVQYAAFEVSPGGKRRTAPDAAWSSSDPDVLKIDSNGLATPLRGGEVRITVQSSGLEGSLPVLILPAGTYRLSGVVTESQTGAPVAGALLEARLDTSSASPPIATVTSAIDGRFLLYGAPAAGYVRVSGDGYIANTERIDLSGPATRQFNLAWDIATYNYSGLYTLAIEAAASCPSAPTPLEPNYRRRTFNGQLAQTGSRLVLALDGPCSAGLGAGCHITGHALTMGATFALTQGPRGFDDSPDLLEDLFTGGFGFDPHPGLMFLGSATTSISAAGLSGSLAGDITYHTSIYPFPGAASERCPAGRFDLTRR